MVASGDILPSHAGENAVQHHNLHLPCIRGKKSPDLTSSHLCSATYIDDVFGPGGIFATKLPHYESRAGQIALARAIDRAFTTHSHVLGEGPCGTGKGIAYSVPAIYHAHHHKKRVLIVTANIALQEQLITKDLPSLAATLPWRFTFALLKGRNNYLCPDRFDDSNVRGELQSLVPSENAQLRQVTQWAGATEKGDKSELPFIPQPVVWSKFAVTSDECKGDSCPRLNRCFAAKAKAAASHADIVVTNYHMLFTHIAVRQETGMNLVLPEFDLLILDEAHEAADIAREFFGFTVSDSSLRNLARDAERIDLPTKALKSAIGPTFEDIADYSRSEYYNIRLHQTGFIDPTALIEALSTLAAWAGDIKAGPDSSSDDKERAATARSIEKRASTARANIIEAVQQSDPGKVYFIELDARERAKLCSKQIDVSATLAAQLFAKCESAALVSATMTTGGTFQFIRSELGVPPEAAEVVAETPFDFARQAMLIIPSGLPSPKDDPKKFLPAITAVFRQVIEASGGRTLGLFTSYKHLDAVHASLGGLPFRILKQGELPRTELARVFKTDTNSVLLGTDSFWTGIDVPGPALSAVVIDKLPFPSPADPIMDALCSRDGASSFGKHMVPRAIMMLRQGVGRLIRARSDVGVVVILDNRLETKGYGRSFLRSLPSMKRGKLDQITSFLAVAPVERGKSAAAPAGCGPSGGPPLKLVMGGKS